MALYGFGMTFGSGFSLHFPLMKNAQQLPEYLYIKTAVLKQITLI
jgi:hypothetical protein